MKKKLFGVLTIVLMMHVSFAQNTTETPKITKGMIKVSIVDNQKEVDYLIESIS